MASRLPCCMPGDSHPACDGVARGHARLGVCQWTPSAQLCADFDHQHSTAWPRLHGEFCRGARALGRGATQHRKEPLDCQQARQASWKRRASDTDIDNHLPALRRGRLRRDADKRVHLLLRVHRLPWIAATAPRRLLRILLLWRRAMPACADGARLLCEPNGSMTPGCSVERPTQSTRRSSAASRSSIRSSVSSIPIDNRTVPSPTPDSA